MRLPIALTLLFLAAGDPVHSEAERNPAVETATFSMYCYWTGEATLGRVEGVVASRIGHWSGSEIVQVDYDPRETSVAELIEALKRQRSFYALVVGASEATAPPTPDDRDDREVVTKSGKPRFIESKYSLRRLHPELLELDLTERQAIQLNSWSYFGGRMPEVLTAEQLAEMKLAPSRP